MNVDCTITVDVGAGAHLPRALEQAQHIAKTLHCFVVFDFNSVRMCVGPNSDLIERQRYFDGQLRAMKAASDKRAAEGTPVYIDGNPARVPKFVMWADLDDVRDIWNWWNGEANLETMFRFFEYLRVKGLVQ
jgi:hypothetical protein